MTRQRHKARYAITDAHVECSCGWREQASNRADGEARIAAHLCTHPPTSQSAWYAFDGTLCVACKCGAVLKGATP